MRTSRWLVFTYSVIIVLGLLIALPNVLSQATLSRLPTWLPHSQVSLGLDLRGGSHLVLEVDEADLTKERLQSLLQDARRVLRTKSIQTKSVVLSQNQIVVTLTDPTQSDAAVTELKTLSIRHQHRADRRPVRSDGDAQRRHDQACLLARRHRRQRR